MEKWRDVWRRGIAPQLPLAGLRALLTALIEDDPRLVQGVSFSPPAIGPNGNKPIESACAVCFAGWKDGANTPVLLSDFFATVADVSENQFDEPAFCRYFFNWFDDAPREVVRRELIPEVQLAIKAHEAKEAHP